MQEDHGRPNQVKQYTFKMSDVPKRMRVSQEKVLVAIYLAVISNYGSKA